MKWIKDIVQAFLDGFLPMFGFIVLAVIAYYAYQGRTDELTTLPVVQEITDNYKIGWEETIRLGSQVASRLIVIETLLNAPTQAVLKPTQPNVQSLELNIPWERSDIEKKLEERGWSTQKRKAAGAYLTYIDRYLDEAVKDMYFTNVSASITLAQGILESNAGRSRLATTTNNHFGIKARPNKAGRKKIRDGQYTQLRDWDFNYKSPAVGVSQHHDDNKWDRFEVYDQVLDSYERHSDLLLNDCKKARKGCYAWIWSAFPVQQERLDLTEMAQTFEPISHYAPEDFFGETVVPYYAAQAAGLKMAGYATSKTYHEKLVYIIETYELWRLDIGLITYLKTIK